MSVLVLIVNLQPFDLAEFLSYAVVPVAAQTPEFLADCALVDGQMPGEAGDTEDEREAIIAAAERLQEFVRPMMVGGPDASGAAVALAAPVARVVTISYH